MPESITFPSAGFSLESVTHPTPASLAVRFTYAPLQVSSSGVHDALNPVNYTLTGPSATAIVSIANNPLDIQTVLLTLSTPLAPGTWVLTGSSSIQTPTGTPLASPNTVTFTVANLMPPPPINPGVTNTAPEAFLRQFLNPALQGDAWVAIIDAIGSGDATNWNNAEYAWDQLFRISASGIFLDRLLGDDGIRRPEGIGLGDDPFRQLGISVRNNQLTQEAILEVLEIFYGTDAVRAYAETAIGQPYALTDGDDLQLLIDGVDAIPVTFSAADFTLIGQATATEVSVAITRAIQQWVAQQQVRLDDGASTETVFKGNSKAFAVAVTNALTGLSTVRIYSGAIGLRSSVQITGGKAQNALLFPEQLPLPATGTDPTTLSWNITIPSPNVMRLQLAGGTLNMGLVHPGDYVNIYGQNFQPQNRGSYPILDVYVAYSGSTLIQYLDVQNFDISPQSGVAEVTLDDVRFYRPLKSTIQTSNGRTVVVNQSDSETCNVIIPATTTVVQRTIDTGAYLHVAPELTNPNAPGAWPISRDSNGIVTVSATGHGFLASTTPAPGPLNGFLPQTPYQVYVDNIVPSLLEAQVAPTQGTIGTSGTVGTTDASPISRVSLIRAGDQVFSSQHQTAAALPNTAASTVLNPPAVALQVGGHLINNNVELIATSVGPSTYTYTVASVGLSPSQPIVPFSVRLTYNGADGEFAIDDGLGNLIPQPNLNGAVIAAGGTVNYTTGVITFTTLAEPEGNQPLDVTYFSDAGTTALCEEFTLLPPPVLPAGGGTSWDYNYAAVPNYPHAVERHAMLVPQQGNNYGGAVVLGGLSLLTTPPTFYNDINAWTPGASSWTSTGATLTSARSSLTVNSWLNGLGLAAGGAIATNMAAVNTVDILDINQSVVTVGPTLGQGRCEAESISYIDPQGSSWVMVIGGRTLALPAPNDDDVLAYWSLDETSGTAAADTGFNANAYNLTFGGTSTPTALGKINYCRDFTTADQGVAAGNTNSTTQLLGPWAIDVWVNNVQNGTPGAPQVIFCYGVNADAGNTLAQVSITYVSASLAQLDFTWQYGSGPTTVTGNSGTFFYDTTYPWHHVGVSKTLNLDGVTYDVQFYWDGQPVGPPVLANPNASATTSGGPTTVPITWGGGNTTSTTNPPQTLSDNASVTGSTSFQVTCHQTAVSLFEARVEVWGSTTGSGGPYSLIAGQTNTSPVTGTFTFSSVSTGSYTNIELHWDDNGTGYNDGNLGPASVTLTGSAVVYDFYVGADSSNANPFAGQLDDLRISQGIPAYFLSTNPSPLSRQPSEFYYVWLRGRGDLLTQGNGELLAHSEALQQGGGAWVHTGNMTYARVNHRSTPLPDGRILVTGGYAYKLGQTFVPSTSAGIAPPTASCEIWDPRTGVWTSTSDMNFPRAAHMAVYLPGTNQVMVLGGYGSAAGGEVAEELVTVPGGYTYLAGGVAMEVIEYWSPETGRWTVGPVPVPGVTQMTGFPPDQYTPVMANCKAVLVSPAATGATRVYEETALTTDGINVDFAYTVLHPPLIEGGIFSISDGTTTIDYVWPSGGFSGTLLGISVVGSIFNQDAGLFVVTFSTIPSAGGVITVTYQAPAGPTPDVVWLAGALAEGGNTIVSTPETAVSTDGVTSVYTYTTPNSPLLPGTIVITSNDGAHIVDDGTGTLNTSIFFVNVTITIDYLTGAFTFTWASPPHSAGLVFLTYSTSNATRGMVYVEASDTVAGGGLEGWQSVASVIDANTFQYQTPAYPQLTVNAGLNTAITPFRAPAAGKVPGPYVWDTSGETPGITSISATLSTPLYKGQQYDQLVMTGSVAAFPDAPGFLVLNFGSSEAVFPVPYFGRFSADSLSIDYTFVMPFDVPAGAGVTLLATKGVFVPPVPEAVGSFYLTDSNSGRIAAESTVENISGAGLNVDITVVYPGDRGLGGEGLPATGQKFSDKVLVWGSNNLDIDETDAREGINLQVDVQSQAPDSQGGGI